jgi:hypothetical protein
MDIEGIIAVAGGILIVLVPVCGFTARFMLKPVIEGVARALQSRQANESLQLLERRMALLEQELAAVRADVQQVGDAKDFYRKLAEPSAAAPVAASIDGLP